MRNAFLDTAPASPVPPTENTRWLPEASQGDRSHLTLLATWADQTPRSSDDTLWEIKGGGRALQGNNLEEKKKKSEANSLLT